MQKLRYKMNDTLTKKNYNKVEMKNWQIGGASKTIVLRHGVWSRVAE